MTKQFASLFKIVIMEVFFNFLSLFLTSLSLL